MIIAFEYLQQFTDARQHFVFTVKLPPREAELEKSRAELEEMHQRSCREAMDRPPPTIVRAYQAVYGRDPKGWPPS